MRPSLFFRIFQFQIECFLIKLLAKQLLQKVVDLTPNVFLIIPTSNCMSSEQFANKYLAVDLLRTFIMSSFYTFYLSESLEVVWYRDGKPFFRSLPQTGQPRDWVELMGDVGITCLNSRKVADDAARINLLQEVVACRRGVWRDSNLIGQPFFTNHSRLIRNI